MFIVNQFSISVNLTDAAATNDANAITGIGAGGPYNGAITEVDAASGASTAIAAGVGVMPLVTTKANFIPFSVSCNYYSIQLTNAVAVLNQPHVMALTHYNLHISPFEYVLDYKLTGIETTPAVPPAAAVANANNILPITSTATALVNYNRANQTFFITIADNAAVTYTAGNSLILQVVFGRQN